MHAKRIRRTAVAVAAAAVAAARPERLLRATASDSSSAGSVDRVAAPPRRATAGSGSTAAIGPALRRRAASAVPKTGAGSFDGMAQDPVATAASNNPALSTLVTAVKKAGLVDTLNNAQNITVFAPTNDAFAKIPEGHPGQGPRRQGAADEDPHLPRRGPEADPDGAGKRLASTPWRSGKVTTSGSGESYTVNGTAKVVCGNVQTANATVYIIDSVLMPTG